MIRTRDTEGLVEVVLDHAKRRNALSQALIQQLTATLTEIGRGPARGVVLGAEGPVFCAGHDYGDMVERDLEGMRALLRDCAELMLTITRIPQPVVARVQGLATGAGCQLALTCDLVVASSEAAFQTPGGKGNWFCTTPMVAVTRAVGSKRALEMLLTGEPVPAAQALEWGMVNRVVPPERLEAEASDLLQQATRGSATSKGIGKQAYHATVALDLQQAYTHATEVMASSSMLPEARAAMQAFMQRKKS